MSAAHTFVTVPIGHSDVELTERKLVSKPAYGQSDATTSEATARVSRLLTAASRGRVQEIISILSAGTDVDAVDYSDRTALHIAATSGQLEAVNVLLAQGANVNVKDRNGATPRDDAVRNRHDDVAEALRVAGGRHEALGELQLELFKAVQKGDSDAVARYIRELPVDSPDYQQRTPLHIAVVLGNVTIVNLLLAANADPLAKDQNGVTPWDEVHKNKGKAGYDVIYQSFIKAKPELVKKTGLSKLVLWMGIWEVIMIVLFGTLTVYDHELANGGGNFNGTLSGAVTEETRQAVQQSYPFYQDVHVMIFIGFGYLMVFLRKNAYSSLAYTFLISAFCIQWFILVGGFWECLLDDHWEDININIKLLIRGDFAAGAVMITYGVLLGKVSTMQLFVIALLEIVIYSLNEAISLHMKITDLGGSMVIHMFGAFFGMAASLVLSPRAAFKHPDNSAVYHSDVMAMIGTIFLWLYWPSFNGALGDGQTQHRAVINTLLSLTGSCVAAFLVSFQLRGHFNMVDVQNATLAGGVAMGTCADLLIQPGSAFAIGAIAGTVSVWGYVKLQPYLETKIGLHDTCGVNNLHGMPSIIGALAGIIASGAAKWSDYGAQMGVSFLARTSEADDRGAGTQAGWQAAYMVITLAIAIAGGIVTGLLVRLPIFDPLRDDQLFKDDAAWEVPHEEKPYYFDARGDELAVTAGKAHDGHNGSPVAAAANGANGHIVVPGKSDAQRGIESRIQGLEEALQRMTAETNKLRAQAAAASAAADAAQQAATMGSPLPYAPYYPHHAPPPSQANGSAGGQRMEELLSAVLAKLNGAQQSRQ